MFLRWVESWNHQLTRWLFFGARFLTFSVQLEKTLSFLPPKHPERIFTSQSPSGLLWKLRRTPNRKAPPLVPAMSWWTSGLHLNKQEPVSSNQKDLNTKWHDQMTRQLHRLVLNLLGAWGDTHRFGDRKHPPKGGGLWRCVSSWWLKQIGGLYCTIRYL